MGRTFTAALKAPVVITTALTHGFHNAPLMYGDEVRKIEKVDGFKTGMVSAGKVSFLTMGLNVEGALTNGE